MTKKIELGADQQRIKIYAALQKVLEVAEFETYFDVYAEVKIDEAGVEFHPEGGKIFAHQYDQRQDYILGQARNFASFCEATGIRPRNPATPWIFDYDKSNPTHNISYDITVDEFRQFASQFGIEVRQTEKSKQLFAVVGAAPVSKTPKESEPVTPAAAQTAKASVSKPQKAAEGITKEQVLIAFAELVKPFDLKKALGNGKGLFGDDGARTQKGSPGAKHAALWNPVFLAVGLHEKYAVPMPHLKRTFFDHPFLRRWSEEWSDTLDRLGE